jgi:dTDP-4-dehydrorhamnose 3,5-epimerase
MNFRRTAISDVVVIEPRIFEDSRGDFMETWESRKYAAGGIDAVFVQDNRSRSRQWVLRGLHYQVHRPQGKLVQVTSGEVFDVAVDIRRSSSTFGKWVGQRLSAQNRRMLWIPPGFAHGFLALTEPAEFFYKCSDFYEPGSERSLLWNDPALGIDWPMPPGVTPILSDKDRSADPLSLAETFP